MVKLYNIEFAHRQRQLVEQTEHTRSWTTRHDDDKKKQVKSYCPTQKLNFEQKS